ncbi:MAG TPA: hypothetical protein VG013_15725, partial [Gemmataceae bacterium]|nr:hypothetical protein [Gemmataceae bacterium]
RPMDANGSPQRAEVRHAEGTSAVGVACFGPIDLRLHAEIASARRTDTPTRDVPGCPEYRCMEKQPPRLGNQEKPGPR